MQRGIHGTPGNCRPCPNHGRWNEIGKWTYCVEDNLEVPLPQPGFYVVQAEDPMEEPVSIRQCFPDVSCPGLNVPAEDAKVAAIAAGEWEADEVQCQVGYTNEGCDTCESGYFRLNSRCAECPPLWQPYLFGTFMMSLILFCVPRPVAHHEQSPSYHIIISAMTIITYSQDIGLFGRYFLHWDDTKEMRALLKWAFLFQLNPEMLALECTQNVISCSDGGVSCVARRARVHRRCTAPGVFRVVCGTAPPDGRSHGGYSKVAEDLGRVHA